MQFAYDYTAYGRYAKNRAIVQGSTLGKNVLVIPDSLAGKPVKVVLEWVWEYLEKILLPNDHLARPLAGRSYLRPGLLATPTIGASVTLRHWYKGGDAKRYCYGIITEQLSDTMFALHLHGTPLDKNARYTHNGKPITVDFNLSEFVCPV